MLLVAGARADARCGTDCGAALHAAARRGDEAVMWLTLAHGMASVRDAKGKPHARPPPKHVTGYRRRTSPPWKVDEAVALRVQLVRPVDEDLYHVPPSEHAYHHRRPRRRSVWACHRLDAASVDESRQRIWGETGEEDREIGERKVSWMGK
jgi:hypothetical protein